jgi:hypothetical protein
MGLIRGTPLGQSGYVERGKESPSPVRQERQVLLPDASPARADRGFGSEVSQAPGDVAKAQAGVRARELGADWASKFLTEKHRLGLAAQPPVAAPAVSTRVATPAEAKALGQLAARSMLSVDLEARIEGTFAVVADSPDFGPGRPLDAALRDAVAGRDLSGVRMQAEQWLGTQGLVLPTDPTDERRVLMAVALEMVKARKGQKARDEGEPVETPEAPEMPLSLLTQPQQATEKGKRMRDAFDAWKASARRPEKTIKAFERHLETFEAMAGDPVLSTMRRADAVRFRDGLQQWAVDNEKTARTADNMLTSIKALATVARDKEWIEGNPFERLAVTKGGKDSAGREPWTPEELVTLFDAPLFTTYQLPEGVVNDVRTTGATNPWYALVCIARDVYDVIGSKA